MTLSILYSPTDFEAKPHLRLFPSQQWHGVENLGERNVALDIVWMDLLLDLGIAF
jgi:hypothetical protein